MYPVHLLWIITDKREIIALVTSEEEYISIK